MKLKLFITLACLAMSYSAAIAQSFWTSAEVKYKVFKNLNLFADGEYRTNDGISATGRWNVSAGFAYKIFNPLKFSAGYTFINQRVATETTRKGNIIPAYWQPKHRVFADFTGSYDWNRFSFSLRERYQYTYRTEKTVPKFDSDGITPKNDELIEAKSKHILRSRLGVEYNIKKSRFTPYINCEFYNSLTEDFDIDKIRYTVGTDYRLNKHNSFELFYRYINERDDDDDVTGHVIGVGYTFKF